jgi:hypothetical protein
VVEFNLIPRKPANLNKFGNHQRHKKNPANLNRLEPVRESKYQEKPNTHGINHTLPTTPDPNTTISTSHHHRHNTISSPPTTTTPPQHHPSPPEPTNASSSRTTTMTT